MTYCDLCGEEISLGYHNTYDGRILCEECKEEYDDWELEIFNADDWEVY